MEVRTYSKYESNVIYAEIERRDLELVLNDGIVRDANGGVVMDSSDSIDYITYVVPTKQYVETYGASYINPVPTFTQPKHRLLNNASNATVRIRQLLNSKVKYS